MYHLQQDILHQNSIQINWQIKWWVAHIAWLPFGIVYYWQSINWFHLRMLVAIRSFQILMKIIHVNVGNYSQFDCWGWRKTFNSCVPSRHTKDTAWVETKIANIKAAWEQFLNLMRFSCFWQQSCSKTTKIFAPRVPSLAGEGRKRTHPQESTEDNGDNICRRGMMGCCSAMFLSTLIRRSSCCPSWWPLGWKNTKVRGHWPETKMTDAKQHDKSFCRTLNQTRFPRFWQWNHGKTGFKTTKIFAPRVPSLAGEGRKQPTSHPNPKTLNLQNVKLLTTLTSRRPNKGIF